MIGADILSWKVPRKMAEMLAAGLRLPAWKSSVDPSRFVFLRALRSFHGPVSILWIIHCQQQM